MLNLIFAIFMALASVATGGQVTTTCNNFELEKRTTGAMLRFYPHVWDELVRSDATLARFVESIRTGGGSAAEVNCRVAYPVNDEGYLVSRDGEWELIRDFVWESEGADGKTIRHHRGMKLHFLGTVRSRVNPCTCKKEYFVQPEFQGVGLCWTPTLCRTMQIPFADAQAARDERAPDRSFVVKPLSDSFLDRPSPSLRIERTRLVPRRPVQWENEVIERVIPEAKALTERSCVASCKKE